MEPVYDMNTTLPRLNTNAASAEFLGITQCQPADRIPMAKGAVGSPKNE